MDPVKPNPAKKRRLIIIISAVVLALLIAGGIAAGVVVSRKNSENRSSSSSSSPGSGTGSGSGTKTSSGASPTSTGPIDPNDPSQFVKDERLKRSFFGLAYLSDGAFPDFGCSIELASVIKDVQLMSQLTKRIRLYGSACNQTAMVLEAIRQTKVDLEVFLGIYVNQNGTEAYTEQRDNITAALQEYGTDHVAGITVGNEFMLNYVTGLGGGEPMVNTPAGDAGAAILIAAIADTRATIQAMNLPKTIPIGNSDAGSFFNTKVMEAIDYGMANVHAWFAMTPAEGASAWVNDFFQTTNVAAAALLPNKPKMYIAETGWPTGSSTTLNPAPMNGLAVAGTPGLQTFLDTFVCGANANGTDYFFFEFKDEEWKDRLYGGVEGHWGLFTKEKELKDVIIPDCPV